MRIAASAGAQEMLAQAHEQRLYPSDLDCGEAPGAAGKIRLAMIVPGLAEHVLVVDLEPGEGHRPRHGGAHALRGPAREIEPFSLREPGQRHPNPIRLVPGCHDRP